MYTMRAPRIQRNLQTLGTLWCVFGAYRIISALVGVFVLRVISIRSLGGGGWEWSGPFHHQAPWMGAVLPLIAVLAMVTSLLAFFVGYGLLTRKPWGRVLGIVIAVLALFKFPIGTALGIYTLWVLAPSESGAEYDAIADHS